MHDEAPLSKTRRKQEMHGLQDIGEQLVALNRAQLDQLGLPESLLDAVLEAKRLNRHEAVRRQMQYIGKIMRTVDAAPIKAKLDEWNGVGREQTARLHLIERWRARLIEDEAAISELVLAYPGADVQHLRLLARNARKEHAANRPPKSSRALFRELRELIAGEPGASEHPQQTDEETEP
jgi:ribosome-associated protein